MGVDRYHASAGRGDIRRLTEAELDQAFLVRHERVVNHDATISFKGRIYEVPAVYIRQRVELRHTVDDPDTLRLYDGGEQVCTLIRYLIHDRDTRFSGIGEWLKSAGAKSVLTSYRSPWQNGVAEHWVLTLRRELLDHVIVLNEAHARRLIAGFVDYYDEDRCHLSLNKDSPKQRPVLHRPSPSAKVVAIPRVGGIHHRYEWRNAA